MTQEANNVDLVPFVGFFGWVILTFTLIAQGQIPWGTSIKSTTCKYRPELCRSVMARLSPPEHTSAIGSKVKVCFEIYGQYIVYYIV
jgi:hypothetical protein